LNIEACTGRTVILLGFTRNTVNISEFGGFRLHLAAKVEYNAHLIVEISPSSTEISSIAY
jgi:hypothetical protein